MCASYESRFSVTQLVKAFEAAQTPLLFEGGLPNLEPVAEVRPTDLSRAVRARPDGRAELVQMRFGFPPPAPKRPPIINFRSEGRRFSNGADHGRCLVPVSGFYEFTGDKYPKTRWVLRDAKAPLLALAAIWRAGRDGAPDAFSLLTAEPGEDVRPYHHRGVVPLPQQDWADWLFGAGSEAELLVPPPAGTLAVEPAPRGVTSVEH
nr:SOS response-associated peptidase family protein [Brevundimonas sp.]